MRCSGLRSLGIIAGLGVATLAAYKAMPWAAERIWWIGGTVAACAGLAVASCLWLARRAVVCVSGFGAPRAIAAGPKVRTIPIPTGYNEVAIYPVGVVVATGHPNEAGAFARFLRSPSAQAVLHRYGFQSR